MGLLFKTAFRYIINRKRHTVLTSAGIILSMVLMVVSFAAVNTVTATRKNITADQNGSYHVLFNNVTKDQVITISNMDIFEKNYKYGVSVYIDTFYSDLSKDGLSEISYLSDSKGNVTSVNFLRIQTENSDMLPSNITALYEGRLPGKDGEIALSVDDCERFGDPSLGDTVEFLVTECVSKGTADPSNEAGSVFEGLTIPSVLEEYYDITSVKKVTYTVVGRAKKHSMISYNDSQLKSFVRQNEKLLLCFNDEANDYYWDMHYAFSECGLEIDDFDFSYNQDYLNLINKGVEAKAYNAIFYALVYMCILFLMFCVRMVIDNAFEISSHERIRQFGVLRAAGASKKQILGILASEAVILSVIGVPLGLMFGCTSSLLIYNALSSINAIKYLSTEYDLTAMLEYSLTPISIASSVIIGFFWVLISAVGTGMRVNKMSPVQAIRAAEKHTKIREPEKKATVEKMGVERLIAFRSIRRNNKRFIITVLSIAMSITAYVLLSYAVEAVRDRISEVYSESSAPFDYEITYSDIYNSGASEIVSQMNETGLFRNVQYDSCIQFIADCENNPDAALNAADASIGYYYMRIHPINETTYKRLTGRDDYADFERSGGMILNNISDNDSVLYTSVPESVTAVPFVNFKTFDPVCFKVWDTYETDINIYSFNERSTAACVAESVYMSYSDRFGGDSSINTYYREDGSGVNVYVRSIYADPAENLREQAKQWLDRRFYDSYEDYYLTEKMLSAFVDISQICGYIAIGLITLIAVVNVVNIISTNVLNRTAEIGMLRACGMSAKQIMKMIFSESVIYSAFSSLCALLAVEGVILVIMLPFMIGKTFTMDDLPIKLSFFAPLKYMLIAAVVSFIAALASALPAVARIISIPVVEAVESVE